MSMSQTAAWPVARFRATLDQILTETGLSQGGLARLVDMNQSQISRWKSGAARPKFDTLKEIGERVRAEYPRLNIGPNELLESAGYSPPEPLIRVSQAEPVDDRRLRIEVTVDREEPLEDLGELDDNERILVATLQAMGKPPESVAGAVRLLREFEPFEAEQNASPAKKRA